LLRPAQNSGWDNDRPRREIRHLEREVYELNIMGFTELNFENEDNLQAAPPQAVTQDPRTARCHAA
jgi:hypothetical protein